MQITPILYYRKIVIILLIIIINNMCFDRKYLRIRIKNNSKIVKFMYLTNYNTNKDVNYWYILKVSFSDHNKIYLTWTTRKKNIKGQKVNKTNNLF